MSYAKLQRGTRPAWASRPKHEPEGEFEERWFHAGCEGKKQHATKRRAKIYARHHGLRGKQRPYRCRFCGGYHLATKQPNGGAR